MLHWTSSKEIPPNDATNGDSMVEKLRKCLDEGAVGSSVLPCMLTKEIEGNRTATASLYDKAVHAKPSKQAIMDETKELELAIDDLKLEESQEMVFNRSPALNMKHTTLGSVAAEFTVPYDAHRTVEFEDMGCSLKALFKREWIHGADLAAENDEDAEKDSEDIVALLGMGSMERVGTKMEKSFEELME